MLVVQYLSHVYSPSNGYNLGRSPDSSRPADVCPFQPRRPWCGLGLCPTDVPSLAIRTCHLNCGPLLIRHDASAATMHSKRQYPAREVCAHELHRTRHKLMQRKRGEEIRATTKVSAHRCPKQSHRKETVHANIRQYTFSPDSQQLQQARHSVWMDNHVITLAPSTQQAPTSRA